jgi:predicted phage terminase large subunit-like protein
VNPPARCDQTNLDAEVLPAGTLARFIGMLAESIARLFSQRPVQKRRRRNTSTLAWGQEYLPAHFAKQASAMHVWLGEQLDAFQNARGLKVNLIGPRGGAKSTIGTLCYVLRAAVEGWEHYIWIVSDTKHQAQTHLENVKTELTENELLAAGYPDAVGRGPRWQSTAIEMPNGVVIESFGTGQRIRGRRRRAHRPTLIVCDDLQNDNHISSAAQREASRQWFHGTLLKAGTKRTNVLNLATALHRDALAMQLDTAAGWTSARFAAIEAWPTNIDLWLEWEEIYTRHEPPAEPGVLGAGDAARAFYEAHRAEMDAGAKVLWPAEEDLYTLMQMRVESGHTAFEREKQGSPVDPELCEWPEAYFEDHIWFHDWPTELTVKTIALDPSKGQDARRGDYSAYVMLGIDPAGVIYVEADLARRPTPQMVVDGAAWCARFRPLAFGVEANQFQELLAGELAAEFRRQGVQHLVPAAIHNQVNKQVRIRRLGPYLSQRRLRFLARSASTRLLVDQLRDFPAGAHDDGPDALEMALRLAEEVWQGRSRSDGLGDCLIRN